MKTIDTHSHFNLHQFEHDVSESITRMVEAEVGTICVGIDLPTSDHAMRLAQEHKSIWACVGQHPTEWSKGFDENEFRKLLEEPRVVAVGECGLDYYRLPAQAGAPDREGIAQQKELFLKQIRLAHEYNLPLMLHIRPEEGTMTAYEEALDMLEEYKSVWPQMRGTAHFFVGTKEIAQRFLDLGFYISFSGVITFVKEYEALVAFVSLERILPETDAPFATPTPYRGTRNHPEYVLEVVKKIAEIKYVSYEETQKQLLHNAQTIFSIL
jgi:TatD DNase family protein